MPELLLDLQFKILQLFQVLRIADAGAAVDSTLLKTPPAH
jgi:hypothetical protein